MGSKRKYFDALATFLFSIYQLETIKIAFLNSIMNFIWFSEFVLHLSAQNGKNEALLFKMV